MHNAQPRSEQHDKLWLDAWERTWHRTRTHVADTARRAFAVAVATLLAASAATGISAALRSANELQARLVVVVFLDASASKIQIETATGLLRRLDGVDSVSVATSEAVQRAFAGRFGNDIDRLLPENPFPAQITLHLAPEFRTASGLQATTTKAERVKNVAEAAYSQAFAEAVDTRHKETVVVAWLTGGMVACAVLILLLSAIVNVWRISDGWPFYEAFVGFVGIVLGMTLFTAGWMLFARQLTWLAASSTAPALWAGCGMLLAVLLVCTGQMQLPKAPPEPYL
jgi:cell division protein FtsX